MNMMELYDSLSVREKIPYNEVRCGHRIAAILPDELDIMKIGGLGNVVLSDRHRLGGLAESELILVATSCPGRASIGLRKDGSVYLNQLVDVRTLTPRGNNVINNSTKWEYDPLVTWYYLMEELGPLFDRKKAHWIIARQYPIVPVARSEMRQLQQAIEAKHPELGH